MESELQDFKEMDAETGKVADADDLAGMHAAVHRVGAKYCLMGRPRVAFWARTIVSPFEPPCRRPACSPKSGRHRSEKRNSGGTRA